MVEKKEIEELKDILDCISRFDPTASDNEKARYFEVIQKDVKNFLKTSNLLNIIK